MLMVTGLQMINNWYGSLEHGKLPDQTEFKLASIKRFGSWLALSLLKKCFKPFQGSTDYCVTTTAEEICITQTEDAQTMRCLRRGTLLEGMHGCCALGESTGGGLPVQNWWCTCPCGTPTGGMHATGGGPPLRNRARWDAAVGTC